MHEAPEVGIASHNLFQQIWVSRYSSTFLIHAGNEGLVHEGINEGIDAAYGDLREWQPIARMRVQMPPTSYSLGPKWHHPGHLHYIEEQLSFIPPIDLYVTDYSMFVQVPWVGSASWAIIRVIIRAITIIIVMNTPILTEL